uniref:E2 ubiquitin-conjugating enzyme n=1 Tax=Glossina brevipalpis TaxID=37001 RepID=A0A1A9X065_9MUSC
MANMAVARIKREYIEVMRSEEITQSPMKLELINDNWTELRGQIVGPPDTPYEGGTFILEIKVPETYPFNPPKIRFVTRIWHPNISSATGAICLDILKDNWAASMSLRTVLLSLQVLLANAEPDDPQDAAVAYQYKRRPKLFEITAKHWTDVYARGPHKCPECDKKIQCLRDMGCNENDARVALSKENWDLEKASQHLFS